MADEQKPVIVEGSVRGMTNGEFMANGSMGIKQEVLDDDVIEEEESLPVMLTGPVVVRAIVTERGDLSSQLPSVNDTCRCSVEELLNEPYDAREFARTLEIIKKGRPTPTISVLTNSGGNQIKRLFKDHYFEKVDWLAGCEALSKLFCWPCLLFDRMPSIWNRTGFDDIYNFHKAFKRHENTQNHIVSSMQLVAFVMNHCEGKVREDADEINSCVRSNRESLRRLIGAVGVAGGASPAGIEGRLLLRLVRREGSPLGSLADLHVSVLHASNVAFNEILKSYIEEAPYVSVIFDETEDGQVAVVLRYTTSKGELQDTFIGFMEGDDLGSIVARLHVEYNLANKLVAILLGALSRVETLPREIKAVILHSPAHRMSAVIPRALQHLKECTAFFHVIHCFRNWLKDPHVEEEIKARVPNSNMAKWRERPEAVLHENREVIQDLVHNLLDKPTAWNPAAYTSALALQHALKDVEFIFLLRVFKELLPVTEALLDMVVSNSPDLKICSETVDDYVKVLNWKKEKFEEIWESVQEVDLEGPSPKKPRHIGTSRLVAYYRSLYETIVDAVVRQVEMRFGAIRYLEFSELINIKDCERNIISEKHIIQLRSKRDDFETTRLRNELLVAYAQVDFQGLQCEQLLRHLYTTGLSGPLRQVTRLARLVLVLPYASRISYDSCSRLFSRIHSFSKQVQSDPNQRTWATVSIENPLFNKMVLSKEFMEKAISVFADSHNNIDLTSFQPKTL